jgi:hypothetical protein
MLKHLKLHGELQTLQKNSGASGLTRTHKINGLLSSHSRSGISLNFMFLHSRSGIIFHFVVYIPVRE